MNLAALPRNPTISIVGGVKKTSSEEEALQQLQKHTVNYAQRITVYKKDGKTVKRKVAEYDQWEKKWMS